MNEYRDRNTPSPLAGDTPIRAVLDHRVKTVFPLLWVEHRLIDRVEGLFPKLVGVHGDEPLRRIPENKRRFRTPGMWILVPQAGLSEQTAYV